ncbi:UDP-N-acetylglucosamine 1-carboxyvinyltransferase, partial [Paramuricea clavata]
MTEKPLKNHRRTRKNQPTKESPTSSLPSTNVRTDIRASFLVFGPLLARTGKAEVYKPGGCDIQKEPRKVDYHIQAMEDMSVQEKPSIEETNIFVKMEVENGLKPAAITFEKSSVGATETAMMAASLVEGDTVIRHAAIEPEIYDLADMLKKMGAKIKIDENVEIAEDDLTDFGIEEEVWNVITVTGRKSLRSVSHRVMPDRIEFGTYAIAAAMNN